MRKQPLPRSQLQQAILKCIIISSASLVVSVNPLMAQDLPSFLDEPETCDYIYGVNDDDLNDSQLFKMTMGGSITPIGPLYSGYDLEALDVSADGDIYAAAGDDTDDVNDAGKLYKVDPETGDLTLVCPTGFAEIDGLSFNPMTGELYGWAQDAGLIKITIPEVIPGEECATLIYPSAGEFEDLTWSNDGTTLYVVKNDHGPYPHPNPYTNATHLPDPENDSSVSQELIAYHVEDDEVAANLICSDVIASLGEIEALEIDTVGTLLVGYHRSDNKPMTAMLNTDTCEINTEPPPSYPSPIFSGMDSDIEALGVCTCIPTETETEWEYAYDPPKDHTGFRDLAIYGIAIKVEGNTFIVAINANMPETGFDVPEKLTGPRKVVDGNVAFSDLVFHFANGSKYAVHFSPENDSSVDDLGVYIPEILKDVTKENLGHAKLATYLAVLGNVEATMGDVEYDENYFPMNAFRKLNMSIEVGHKVLNDGFKPLSEAELLAKGLDFATGLGTNNKLLGKHIFGFEINKQMDMRGAFIASLFTECSNDGISIIGELPGCPDGSEDLEED
jgi:hypothetical protein